MQNNLQLIQNEHFGELECNIYRDNDSGELLFTREQIGMALEYSKPNKNIDKLHARHRERLNQFSTTVTLGVVEGGRQVQREMILYTRKGVFEICRWSRQPKADAFMDFVWEVTDRLMSGEVTLVPTNQENGIQSAEVNQRLGELATDLKLRLDGIDQKISKVEESASYSNYYLRMQMRSGYDENWKRRQGKNIKEVSKFIGKDGKLLLKEIYREMENRYGIDLDAFTKDYKRTKGLSTCSTLSVISFSLTLREMFDTVINEVMSICSIVPATDSSTGQSRLLSMAYEAAEEHDDDLPDT